MDIFSRLQGISQKIQQFIDELMMVDYRIRQCTLLDPTYPPDVLREIGTSKFAFEEGSVTVAASLKDTKYEMKMKGNEMAVSSIGVEGHTDVSFDRSSENELKQTSSSNVICSEGFLSIDEANTIPAIESTEEVEENPVVLNLLKSYLQELLLENNTLKDENSGLRNKATELEFELHSAPEYAGFSFLREEVQRAKEKINLMKKQQQEIKREKETLEGILSQEINDLHSLSYDETGEINKLEQEYETLRSVHGKINRDVIRTSEKFNSLRETLDRISNLNMLIGEGINAMVKTADYGKCLEEEYAGDKAEDGRMAERLKSGIKDIEKIMGKIKSMEMSYLGKDAYNEFVGDASNKVPSLLLSSELDLRRGLKLRWNEKEEENLHNEIDCLDDVKKCKLIKGDKESETKDECGDNKMCA